MKSAGENLLWKGRDVCSEGEDLLVRLHQTKDDAGGCLYRRFLRGQLPSLVCGTAYAILVAHQLFDQEPFRDGDPADFWPHSGQVTS